MMPIQKKDSKRDLSSGDQETKEKRRWCKGGKIKRGKGNIIFIPSNFYKIKYFYLYALDVNLLS